MNNDKIIKRRIGMNSDFNGTIIDIETIGEFDYNPVYEDDSRRVKNIQQVILGLFGKKGIRIFCARGKDTIRELNSLTAQILDRLERPFYAFNANFESGVWFHQLDKKIIFDGELQGFPRENKGNARKSLGIPNYDDPFNDDGYLCMIAWERRQFEQAIAHNKACLLKERDILLKRYLLLNKKCSAPFPFNFSK
ncbi:MAG: hypothetical protein ACETVW_05780 [Dehalococcoidia bacterium]